MDRGEAKAGLITVAILLIIGIGIILVSGLLIGITYGNSLLFGFNPSFNHAIKIMMISALVAPFFFFVCWALYELIRDLYGEALYFLDTHKKQR
ncbi:hypothetical protein HER14_10575 [Acidithiobacillus thiooxidans]|jgi:hypothetical protein|uniref:hypothetical protein n=1 Tax=Acidithiobacillus thiooxidans TaxID=930 RepID=UPI001C07D183|nr:hypothetical protein [Acidithiobacillus thiooxidans]MBU2751370.1 hypothetical protein [Acidithiobacillus thiooxidans]MBU2844167.1 hypothetical protein [Acidithiobacillus thiooxidans]